MSFDDLTNDNILIYAVKAYDKPNCIMSEFKEDMKRFSEKMQDTIPKEKLTSQEQTKFFVNKFFNRFGER